MDPKKDYYRILGVPEGASAEEIRKAFRRLAKKHHPDVNPGDKAAESRFKEANEAHEILSDRKKREEYDAIRQGGFAGGFPGAGPFGGGHAPGGSVRNRSTSGISSATCFAAAEGGSRIPAGERYPDRDFRRLPRHGPGGGPRDPVSSTPRVRAVRWNRPRRAAGVPGMLRTRGDGSRGAGQDPDPRGSEGRRHDPRPFEGGGTGGSGESGDLQVELRMLAHPYFRREGNDILLEAPIRFSEAIKGAKIEVPTIDGPVTVTIPPAPPAAGSCVSRGGVSRRPARRSGETSMSCSRWSSRRTGRRSSSGWWTASPDSRRRIPGSIGTETSIMESL